MKGRKSHAWANQSLKQTKREIDSFFDSGQGRLGRNKSHSKQRNQVKFFESHADKMYDSKGVRSLQAPLLPFEEEGDHRN